MFKYLYPVFVFFAIPFFAAGQTAQPSNQGTAYIINGSVTDTLNFMNTGYTSVSVLNAADSLLQSFTRVDETGKFTLKVNSAGKYLLMVAHPSFAIYVDVIDVQEPITSLAPVNLTSKKQMLHEIVITDAKAIVIKGDTIEYKADSFQTRAFDNVDELLKKLPGIEIGKDGKIRAYGKDVKKMTVDGEEFFSDDPAIVSKTLRASAVDKVQVFDKKSDQAAFSGVDDGERIKTINLQLKESAKKGYFGKAQLGAGLPDYWENIAMINAFKGKQKIAAYGIMSNTNTNGLNWEDMRKYGSSGSPFMDENSGVYVFNTDDNDWDGQYSGSGLPKSWVGGALYNNKWKNDSLIFTSSYRFLKKMNEGLENVSSQYILPDTQYFNTQQSSNRNISIKHIANVSTEYWIDTSSSLKVTVSGQYNTFQNLMKQKSESLNANGVLINNNTTDQETEGSDKSMNAELFYKKRFRKKGRTFTANFKGGWKEGASNGILNSDYVLFALDSNYVINQRKENNSTIKTGQIVLNYTEPVTEKLNLQFTYGYSQKQNNAENNSYDIHQGNTGQTDVFNPFYSSHFLVDINQNKGGISLKYNTKKISASIGSEISESRFNQQDKLFDTTYHYSYLNLLPKASFQYHKSQNTQFTLRYSGIVNQPELNQLQPLRNNTDPLNLTIGNPDLKQSYTHRTSVNYSSYKVLSSQWMSADVNLDVTQNAISLNQYVDNNGRSVNQYVNVSGNYRGNVWAGFNKKIKEVSAGFYVNGTLDHDNNFINGLKNINDRLYLSPTLSASYNKDTTWDFDYRFSPGYNYNKSSIRSDITTTYWQFRQEFNVHISLPGQFRFGSEMTLDLRQKLNPMEKNNNVFKWNLSLSRFFLKDRSLEAKVYINDLLDQNAGYSRYNTATYVSEKTYTTIRRYAMFSLIWNFTKLSGKASGASTSE
jgi:hypothetical protein